MEHEKLADLGDISLCYQTFGNPKDPAVILIMGLATQMIHWDEELCQYIASLGFYVVRFDNRDIGLSTRLTESTNPSMTAMLADQWFNRRLKAPYLLDDMAKDTCQLLNYLEIKQCHIIGVSMGGMIGQCVAINYPDRVLSLTSIMSTTGNRELPKATKTVMFKVMKPPPRTLSKYIPYGIKLWKLLHAQHYPFHQQRVENLLVKARERCFYPAGVWRQTCAIVASPDRTDLLKHLNIPALVIHGDADPLVPLACGEATAAAIPNAKFKVIKGMGHTLPKEMWHELTGGFSQIANL